MRISAQRDARSTFADKPHAKMVRAVRQGGLAAPARSGDLSDLAARLRRVYDKLRSTAFGYDALDPYGSAMTSGGPSEGGPEGSGLTKSVADCAALIGRYGDTVNRAIEESGRGPCADWQDALTLLALKAGDPTLAAHPPADIAATVAANEDLASTPADEVYSALVRVISDWLPGATGDSFGIDSSTIVQGVQGTASSIADSLSTTASSAYDAVSNAASSARDAASNALSSAASAASDALPSAQDVKDSVSSAAQSASQSASSAWQSTKDAYQSAKTSLSKEVDDEVDRVEKPVTDAVPWLKAGVVIAGVGVIGYALAQIATLTSGLRAGGARR